MTPEITLIGTAMADPKGYAKTQVFGADVYLRVTEVTYKFDSKKPTPCREIQVTQQKSELWHLVEDIRDEGAKAFETAQVMAAFLNERINIRSCVKWSNQRMAYVQKSET